MCQNVSDVQRVYYQVGEFEFHVQVGSKLFPEYPVRLHAEAYYQLNKTLGVQSNIFQSLDVKGTDYERNKMILGFDSNQKVLAAGMTGLNKRAGDLMVNKFKYTPFIISGADVIRVADCMHLVFTFRSHN